MEINENVDAITFTSTQKTIEDIAKLIAVLQQSQLQKYEAISSVIFAKPKEQITPSQASSESDQLQTGLGSGHH